MNWQEKNVHALGAGDVDSSAPDPSTDPAAGIHRGFTGIIASQALAADELAMLASKS